MAKVEKLIGSESPLEVGQKINEIIEKGVGGSGFNLFDTKISDHILDGEEAIGWMLQGSYVNGAVYPDFYAKCIEEYNEATETETVNEVTVKVNTNGHKFFDIADKASIDAFYNTIGSAWFYGIDTENERIFLPRNNWFEQATTDVSEVGNFVEAGLPNITGAASSWTTSALSDNSALYAYDGNGRYIGGGMSANGLAFDASRSNSIYGKSDTVQPNAVKKLLYICVGNTIVNEDQIDVSKVLSEAVLRSSLVEAQTVIETYKNGTSWYRIWSDGFCEQSGKTDKGTKIEITLLKPYKDTNYQIMVGQYHTGATDMHGTVVRDSKTVSGFTIAGNANVDFNWEAKGYIW